MQQSQALHSGIMARLQNIANSKKVGSSKNLQTILKICLHYKWHDITRFYYFLVLAAMNGQFCLSSLRSNLITAVEFLMTVMMAVTKVLLVVSVIWLLMGGSADGGCPVSSTWDNYGGRKLDDGGCLTVVDMFEFKKFYGQSSELKGDLLLVEVDRLLLFRPFLFLLLLLRLSEPWDASLPSVECLSTELKEDSVLVAVDVLLLFRLLAKWNASLRCPESFLFELECRT
ncbi:hypothetical protein T05_13855 [Trichinella murrelli]|uniref:Uncharacterized protein n=1 Tax=Trichinella murrelli TaxID=144512 RepID=A0A0V0TSW6_9BILA|nr:hypothetical protein T05_13855 [Trichinella murrelli]